MNNGAVLFLGILLSLAGSFWALLLAPQLQIGRQQVRALEGSGELYPAPRPGLAQRGAQVYVAQGCAECHTRQVRQTGANFEVRLTDLGTNPPAVVSLYSESANNGEPGATGTGDETMDRKFLKSLPATVATNLTGAAAVKVLARFADTGATAVPVLIPLGPDIQRGWGARLSVPQDYLNDYPVQLGGLRLGPDLANYGARQTNAVLTLQKLYAPVHCGLRSEMPAYRYLFKTQSLTNGEAPPASASFVWPATTNSPGSAVFASEDATALAAYLGSLRANASLFEGPVSKPPAPPVPAPTATNAPAAK